MHINGRVAKFVTVAIGLLASSFWRPAPSLAFLPPAIEPVALALSPDGQVVALSTWEKDRQIKVWNVHARFSYPGVRGLSPRHIKFSPDGRNLWAATAAGLGNWELATGLKLPVPKDGFEQTSGLAVPGDWAYDAAVNVTSVSHAPYELEVRHDDKVAWRLPYTERDAVLAFSTDGKRLAYVGRIQTSRELPLEWSKEVYLRIFETGSGEMLHSLPIGQTKALKACFTTDGSEIAVAFADSRVDLLDTTTANRKKSFVIPPRTGETNSKWPGRFDFSSDGEMLVSTKGDIQLWKVREGTLQTTLKLISRHGTSKTAFSSDKKTMAVGVMVIGVREEANDPVVYVYDVESGQLISTFR